MSKTENTWTITIHGGDIILLCMFTWLALDNHPAWWLGVGFVVFSCFVPPALRRITLFKQRKRNP